MDNAFLLLDRIDKIRSVIDQYGEDKFYISFSGGKDSTVLSALIDMAVPNNKIPRVFADTGIELNMIRDFVKKKAEHDSRFVIIQPSVPITKMLREKGYPFKSKVFSIYLERFQDKGMTKGVKVYSGFDEEKKWKAGYSCPESLRYLFTEEHKNDLKVSARCCDEMKKKPLKKFQKESGRSIPISGVMRDEGGGRDKAACLAFSKDGKIKAFQPLAVMTKEWEEWFIDRYNVEICEIYHEPYNFYRTGCKGCPFALHLQDELDTLEKFFPAERKQCEIIWKPVYDEYRRIKYRLRK